MLAKSFFYIFSGSGTVPAALRAIILNIILKRDEAGEA